MWRDVAQGCGVYALTGVVTPDGVAPGGAFARKEVAPELFSAITVVNEQAPTKLDESRAKAESRSGGAWSGARALPTTSACRAASFAPLPSVVLRVAACLPSSLPRAEWLQP